MDNNLSSSSHSQPASDEDHPTASSSSHDSQPASDQDHPTASNSSSSIPPSSTSASTSAASNSTPQPSDLSPSDLSPPADDHSVSQNYEQEDEDEQQQQQQQDEEQQQEEDDEEEEDSMDVDTTTEQQLQLKSSTGKEKMADSPGSSGSENREGKTEEIGLLMDLHALHKKTQRYLIAGDNAWSDFYKYWIEEIGDYKSKKEVDDKIEELHARFLKNMDESVESPTDPIDAAILQLSLWIWGHEINDSSFGKTDEDQDLTAAANAVDDQQKAGSKEEEEEDSMDVDTTTEQQLQPKPSTGKEKMADIPESSGSGNREGKTEEIGLLTDLYALHNKTQRYMFSGANPMRDFYNFWIEEVGDYKSIKEVDDKIEELHERFLKNMDQSVEAPTDPIDIEILQLSSWIWGQEINDEDQDDDHDNDDGGDHQEGGAGKDVITDHAISVDDQQKAGSKDDANAVDEDVYVEIVDEDDAIAVNDQDVANAVDEDEYVEIVDIEDDANIAVNDQDVAVAVDDQDVAVAVDDQDVAVAVDDQDVAVAVDDQDVAVAVDDQDIAIADDEDEDVIIDDATQHGSDDHGVDSTDSEDSSDPMDKD
ncbi:hypothetical protein QVD17_40921 [Tagetes erecta]|uniref:Uncharacterized protein n=1 Tax=Tagetes erecta TaxID=13708 RepID=A0AAD8JWG0_TARER|nr:hypothetical protein QVD17_40921 [Tagetes erecta]